MIVGLRELSLRELLKKNLNFAAGIISEIGLALAIIIIAMLISFTLLIRF